MKLMFAFICIFLATFLSGYLAWWLAPILCFSFFYFYDCKPWQAFTIGMTASGFAWQAQAYMKESNASVKISGLLASIFGNIEPSHIYLLLFLTVGLICGFSSLSSRLLREIETK